MLEIYADGALIYDSRVPEAALLELKVTKALNKGGTATITVPPWHALYNALRSYRTLVEIYRDGERIFRGRSLYPSNTFEMVRTFTCEGERCFLNDAVLHGRHLYREDGTGTLTNEDIPGGYLYQASPEEIFRDILAEYNAQVMEPFKQFEVGVVDVTDSTDYVRLENGDPESVAAVIDKLVERCGGYVTFEDGADGLRIINWRATLDHTAEQQITFGSNLLDFASSDENTELATVIVPYGAVKNESTGERYTIRDVNGGKDYLTASESVLALRGWIWKSVMWDDVTEPARLKAKAEAYLADSQHMLTTLALTALDLSVLDKNIKCFQLGDIIKVVSPPHAIGVGDDKGLYQLTEMTLDLLNPQNDSITLTKTVASLIGTDVVVMRSRAPSSLTGAGVAATMQASSRISKVSGALRQAEETFRSEIEQIPERIQLSVSGSLGGTASITMSVGGTATPVGSIDLSGVRQAFANDTSAVTISAGTITFNSGSLVINSSKCKLTASGVLTVEDAVVKGEITTIEGSYRTEMSNGSLRLYYSDALCGTVNTKYWSGASGKGLSLRAERGGEYIMFSHYDETQGSGYKVDYYLNAGWSPNYAEKHIFQTSVRFLDDVYSNRTHIRSLRLYDGTQEYLVEINNGQVVCSPL